jgi:hypothetical protein
MVGCDGRVREFSADRFQCSQGAYLISTHKPAVADHVSH